MKYDSLTFITGNKAKLEVVRRYFRIPFDYRDIDLPEVQSLDLGRIVSEKVRAAYAVVGKPVFVEDVSLEFKSFGRLPGTLVKWFLQEIGNEGLCRLIDPDPQREAIATVAYAFFDGQNLKIFTGSMTGKISEKPLGKMAFGWDPIFIPTGFDRTWSQLEPIYKDKVSMRAHALSELRKYLS